MKRHRTSSDFGLYKNLKANKKKLILVICSGSVVIVFIISMIIYLFILLSETSQIPKRVSANAQIIHNTQQSPKPFGVNVLGRPPQQFTPTPSTIPPTTKKTTTVNYPQLNYYRQHYYPKSIQEVIDYVTEKTVEKDLINIGEEMKRDLNTPFTEPPKDNFNSFKPGDPSEINLLATGSVRFAPPIWRQFNRFNHKPIPIRSFINMSNLEMPTRVPRLVKNPVFYNKRLPDNTDVLATVKKPLMVSINIVPMENKRFQNHRDTKKEAMTLNLKVLPDMTYFDDDRRYKK